MVWCIHAIGLLPSMVWETFVHGSTYTRIGHFSETTLGLNLHYKPSIGPHITNSLECKTLKHALRRVFIPKNAAISNFNLLHR